MSLKDDLIEWRKLVENLGGDYDATEPLNLIREEVLAVIDDHIAEADQIENPKLATHSQLRREEQKD